MRVAVIGKHGQLARSLMEKAPAHPGLDITVLGRPEFDLEKADDVASLTMAAAPDVVVNAAAYTAVDQAEDEPERARRINGSGAAALAAATAKIGARIIHISTDYVFDGRANVPYREDDQTNPIGAYGRSKLEGEIGVRRENPDHLILRTAWVYSPFGHNFVKTMIELAKTREFVSVVGDQLGNPTSALDLAAGIVAVLENWRMGKASGLGQTYHLAGSGEASWFDFAIAVFDECRAYGLPAAKVGPIATADWPTKARRPANSRLDSSKFAADLGFVMPPWRVSLRETVRRLRLADM